MINVLKNETEAIARCEAATLISKIYVHRGFTDSILQQIYEVMSQAAVVDLHWEVKLNALLFWEKVINNHLQNQGMIDGTFPNVTFSKEHRKIVTLNEAEVKARLNKVLVQLSECKCLSVLMFAMQDDCDFEVSKKAVEITQKLANLLKMYNVSLSTAPMSPSSASSGFSSPASQRVAFSEEVVNDIVNANDLNLLGNVYNYERMDSGVSGITESRSVQIVAPETFFGFIQKDLSGIVTEKTKWLSSIDDLNSLLDDMLKSYEDEVNSMDCY